MRTRRRAGRQWEGAGGFGGVWCDGDGGIQGLGDRGRGRGEQVGRGAGQPPQEVWEGAVLSPISLVPFLLASEPWLRARGGDQLPWVLSAQLWQQVPGSAVLVV